MNTSATATIKPIIRLKTGKGFQIGVRCPLAVLDQIDQWAAAQPDKPKRAEAILRLVQEALADTTDKQLKIPHNSITDAPEAEVASPNAPTPTSSQPPPQSETGTQHLKVGGEQPAPKVRWTPRLVETTRPSVRKAQVSSAGIGATAPCVTTPRPQWAAKPKEDNRPYDMPEDIDAFNEYWKRAEHLAGRRLEYEEVVVSYNRYRQGI